MKLSQLNETIASRGQVQYTWYDDAEHNDRNNNPYELAHLCHINISRTKEPSILAISDGLIVGAAFYSFEPDYNYDEETWTYDFDVVVDPDYRGPARIGMKLIDNSIKHYQDLKHTVEGGNTQIRVWVVNPKLAPYLERLGFNSDCREWSQDCPHMTYNEQLDPPARQDQ